MGKHEVWVVSLLLLCGSLMLCQGAELEGFEESFGAETHPLDGGATDGTGDVSSETPVKGLGPQQVSENKEAPMEADRRRERPPTTQAQPTPSPQQPRNWLPEMLAAAFFAAYGINWYFGRRHNTKLALTWARHFAREGGVLERNFSALGHLGDNEQVLLRDSPSCFKFYASGRRFCQSLSATLDLRKRPDLLSRLANIIIPSDDRLDIEVVMNDNSMPPFVMVIAPPKLARNLEKENEDIAYFSRKVDVTRDRIATWPSDRLAVLCEQNAIFYDLMTEPLVDQVFGRQAFEALEPYFRFLHFSSEVNTPSRKVLRFAFALPPPHKMEALSTLMAAVPVFIDLVGNYRFTPEQRRRAEERRSKLVAEERKKTREERESELAEKKAAKRREEMERIRALPPGKREKAEERREKVERRRAMKMKMIRA